MKYEEQLRDAVAYAASRGSFNKVNLIELAKNVCVFGLGTYFREAFAPKRVKEKYRVNLVSDNDSNKWGKAYEGLICVPPEELLKYEGLVTIIMAGDPSPIQKQLDQMGIAWVTHVDLSVDDTLGMPKEKEWFKGEVSKIQGAYELLEDEESCRIYVNAICNRIAYPLARLSWQEMFSGGEYFSQPFMKLGDNEVYVDCGAYDGDTILHFQKVAGKWREIHAFEMDLGNYNEMVKNLKNVKDVFLYNEGVWSENKEIAYGCGSGSNEPRSGISIMKRNDGKQYLARAVKLDDVFRDKGVTLIKMDIEGAEMEALVGAKELISRCKPKLAICVYHKTSDFWNVPLLLKQWVPEYHLRLRHHAVVNCWGTVLYAYC